MDFENRSLTTEEINFLAADFESRSLEQVLSWSVDRFGAGLVMTSNFGAEGLVVLDHLMKIAPQTPVVYIETGFQFAATDELKHRLIDRYNLNLMVARASLAIEEQDFLHGPKLYETDPDKCCAIRKVEPLREALLGYDAWIAALRRDQSPTRALIKMVEWNARHNLVKLNPLARWTKREVWDYILKHNLPYNRLLDEGYTSIGCQPCTRRPEAGAHERSGRWSGHQKLECGIHL